MAGVLSGVHMALIDLSGVKLSYGGPPLFDDLNLNVDSGDRLCLLGRNGAGKSTLLKVLAGKVRPDSGRVSQRQDLRVELLDQEVPQDMDGSVFEIVAGGLGKLGGLLAEYRRIQMDDRGKGLEAVGSQLEALGGWGQQHKIDTVLTRLGLSAEDGFNALSGGWKRRVLLARNLVAEPDVLLLDEPTNHLDIQAIEWLEEFLPKFRGALVLVTHDRRFMRKIASKIAELERGRVLTFPGDYRKFQEQREALLIAEAQQQAVFDRKLAQEEAWIRQGIKARRTRNEGRVRALESMRKERQQRRNAQGEVKINIDGGTKTGRLVCEAEQVDFAYGDQAILQGVSLRLMRGDKVGLLGPNGVGKTTLLRLLVGDLAPKAGRLRFGERVEPAYFDQMRDQLDENRSVAENVGQGRDSIELGGRTQHINRYLKNFLFSDQQAHTPVGTLSGGERNRVLLARLFSRPANMLVLDEPTNDLDVETLELLESMLVEFTGTILLVSHDRAFLDNVVTSTLAFEGGGRVKEYIGGYSDWLRQRQPADEPEKTEKKATKKAPPRSRARKLSYKQEQERKELPGRIEELEQKQSSLHQELANPAFYKGDGEQVAAAKEQLAGLERDLEEAYMRWEELEELADN